MAQMHHVQAHGRATRHPAGASRKPGQVNALAASRAGLSCADMRRSALDELATFEVDCKVAFRDLRGERLRLEWISVPMPARALHDPATLARLEGLAAEDPVAFAKLRFEIEHRYLVAEFEHLVGVQASLGAARLALAVQLEPDSLPLANELSRSGVKLLFAPPALGAGAAVDRAARAELHYIARLARAIDAQSAVHVVRNRAALAQCLAAGIDQVAAPCHARGTAASAARPMVGGRRLN